MTAFKELLIGGYVLRFWPSDNGWICGITESMMDALAQQTNPLQRTWVELEQSDMPDGEDPMFDHQYFLAGMMYADKILKEKNS